MGKDLINKQTELDVVELIDLGNKYLCKEITIPQIIELYGPKYVDLAKSYVESFGTEYLDSKINTFLSGFKDETLRKLNEEGLSELLADTSIQIGLLVKKYVNKEITPTDFMSALGDTGIKEISDRLISAYNIDVSGIKDMAMNIAKERSLVVSYAAFSEAYKVMMSVLEDAAVQHEHRLMVEKECEKAIKLIKQYRENMQELITKYFDKHLKTFEHGFAMMDKAIEENDSNGYIKGNAEIQKTLGYYAQFRNQKEFDELMDSDINFKL